MSKFVDSNSDFALKLLKQISKDNESSFISPASLSAALGMAYIGAEGDTKTQMNKLIFSELNDQEIKEGMQSLIKSINEPIDGCTLITANRLYVEKSYQILQTFLDSIRKCYYSDCISANFASNPDSVASEINVWVEHVTNKKIQNFIKPDVLNSLTRQVLVNAVYFKGNWLKEFDETNTRKMPFHLTAENTVNVDMMSLKMNDFEYNQTEKCQILGVPYKSPSLVMYIVLPTKRNGLNDFTKGLTGAELVQLFRTMYQHVDVEVSLPKFKLEYEYFLVEPLQQLGCKDMFSEDADFSNISGRKELFVSNVIHKTFIEVNEKGAEAAAASAVDMMCRCAPEEFRFIANHPFLFSVVERKSMTILFLGQYYG